MTTYPIADPLRGKTVPDDGAFATDTQVMTGASPQAGVKGGVNCAGAAYATGIPSFGAKDFTLQALVIYKGGNTDAVLFDATSGLLVYRDWSTNGLGQIILIKRTGATVLTSSIPLVANTPTNITVTRVAGVTKLYFDSTEVGSAADANDYGTSQIYFGCDAGLGTPFVGDLKNFRDINRGVTADEIKALNKGEIPAELARQAASQSFTMPESGDVGNQLTVSGGDLTFTKIAGANPGALDCVASSSTFSAAKLNPGDQISITYEVSQTVGAESDLPVLNFGDYGTFNFRPTLLRGKHTLTFTYDGPVGATGMYLSVNYSQAYGVSTNASTFSFVAAPIVKRNGTVEHFAASEVTSLGRWIGKFGTSLIPGAGITPLDPQPVQVRMEQFRYDLSSSTALDSPSGWTLVKNATGELHITPPTYANATARPVYTAVSQATQNVVDCSVNTTTGVAVLINRVTSTGTPSDATVQGHITYRE